MNHLDQSKLIQLLKLLSDKEFANLKIWLSSPWAKTNKYFIPFFNIIERTAPDFSAATLTKEKVYAQLYDNKKYNNKIFNNLLLLLTKEVENYLVQLQLRQEEDLKQQLLGKVLLAHNEVKLFEKTTQQSIKKLEKKIAKSAGDHLLLHQLNESLHFQASGHHRYKSEAPLLEQANTHLDAFYTLEKLRYLQEKAARTKILKTAPNEVDAALLALLNQLQIPLQLPVLTLYNQRLNQEKTLDVASYNSFKQVYLKLFPSLHFSFQQLFLFCCINDTLALNTRGYYLAMEELFGWYRLGLREKLLFQNDRITGGTYNNIILTACHLKEYTFLNQFIATYSAQLPEPIRDQAHLWAKEQLNYVLKNYGQVVTALNKWLPTNKVYVIQAKITLLKAHFKLAIADKSQLKSFESYCSAFEKYILRNQLYAKNKSISYLKFIQHTKKIVRLKYVGKKTQQWNSLLQVINNEAFLIGKQWLKAEIALLDQPIDG